MVTEYERVPRYLIDVPRQMKHCLVLLAGSTTRTIKQVGLASKRSDWGVLGAQKLDAEKAKSHYMLARWETGL